MAGTFSVPGTDIVPVTFSKVARMAYVGHKLPDGVAPGLDETVFYDPTGMGSPSGLISPMSRSIRIPGSSTFSTTSPSTTSAR